MTTDTNPTLNTTDPGAQQPPATDPMKDPSYLAYVAAQQKNKLVADYSADPLRKPLLEEGGLGALLDSNPGIVLDAARLATAIEFAQANVLQSVKKKQAEDKTQNAATAATTTPPPAGDTAKQSKPLAEASYKEILEATGGNNARAADVLAYVRKDARNKQGRIELT